MECVTVLIIKICPPHAAQMVSSITSRLLTGSTPSLTIFWGSVFHVPSSIKKKKKGYTPQNGNPCFKTVLKTLSSLLLQPLQVAAVVNHKLHCDLRMFNFSFRVIQH